jgi:carbon monoxide dehydrogenase subunit G
MKVTRMTLEGAKGWANIARRDDGGRMVINIHGDGAAGLFEFTAATRDHRSQEDAAARLQRELDGYQGAAGDMANYLRAIQNFAD